MSEAGGTIDDGTLDEVTRRAIELLAPLGAVTAQRLFGTWGLYLEDRIFGLVHDGIIYFRTSRHTVARYAALGAQPFLYRRADGRSSVMQYHEVPAQVLEDVDEACAWAAEAAGAAAGSS